MVALIMVPLIELPVVETLAEESTEPDEVPAEAVAVAGTERVTPTPLQRDCVNAITSVGGY